MERELKESEERHRFLFNHLLQGAVYLDAETRIFSANPAAAAMIGKSQQELIGQLLFLPGWPCIHEDGRPYTQAELPPDAALRTRQPVQDAVIGVYNPNIQAHRWFRMSAVPIFKPGEATPHQLFATFYEISGLKKAEAAREETAARYISLVEHLPDLISRFDRDLRLAYISPGIEKLTGQKPASLIGHTNQEMSFPPQLCDLWDSKLRLVFETGQEQVFDYTLHHLAGQSLFEARLFPEYGQNGQIQSVLVIDRDITDLRAAQAEAHEVQRRLQTLFDNLPGLAYRCTNDVDWTMEFVSRGSLALTGYPPAMFLGENAISYTSLIHPEDRQASWDGIQAALALRQPYALVYRITTRGGETRWVEENGLGIFKPDGTLEALEGFILDITARRRGEEALLENETSLRQILERLPAAVMVVEPDGRVAYLSASFTGQFGYSLKEIPDLRAWENAAFPDRVYRTRIVKAWQRYLEQVRQGDNGTAPFEFRMIARDGRQRIVEARVAIQRERIIATFNDITEIRAAEEDLLRGEAYMRQLLEEAPVAACIANLDRQVEFTNRQFDQLFGLPQGAASTLDLWAERVYPDAQERAAALTGLNSAMLSALHSNGVLPVLETRLTPPNGKAKNVRLRGSIIRGKLFLTFEDITAYREIEEKLTANLAEKETLLREVYHRVKNNLQVVVSLLGLQALRIKDPESRDLFTQSQSRIRSMALAHETLYRSAGFTRINFGSYLNDLVQEIRIAYPQQTNINVRVEAEPVFIPIDTAVPCGLIVNELVTNAFKYAFPEDQPGSILVKLNRKDGLLRLEVSDDGVGLPGSPEAPASDALGLNLVRILSSQVNASVQITRERGTVFRLTLTNQETPL